MSIDGVRPNSFRVASPRPKLDGAGRGGFTVAAKETGTPARARAPGAAGSASEGGFEISPLSASMLAAVQEYGAEPPGERAARRQGALLLRQLGLLQLSLLSDGPDEAALDRLYGLAAALEEAIGADIDPGLRRLLRNVALRARLELARHRHMTK
jgi:hypothetical protein